MSPDPSSTPPPPPYSALRPVLPKPIMTYVRVIDAISKTIGIITMYLVVAMILVLLTNAITRNILNIPIHWAIEMAQFILAAYYIVGGAYSMQLGTHVRMDLLYEKFSERGKARMDAFTSFFLVFYLITLLIGAISSTKYAIDTNQILFSMWSPSLIPIKVIMVLGIILMLLQAVSMFFKDIAKLRGAPIT